MREEEKVILFQSDMLFPASAATVLEIPQGKSYQVMKVSILRLHLMRTL